MTFKDLIKKYVYYGPEVPSSRPILAVDLLDLRKKMKRLDGPILRPRLGEMKK
jgi:hypothetical protein